MGSAERWKTWARGIVARYALKCGGRGSVRIRFRLRWRIPRVARERWCFVVQAPEMVRRPVPGSAAPVHFPGDRVSRGITLHVHLNGPRHRAGFLAPARRAPEDTWPLGRRLPIRAASLWSASQAETRPAIRPAPAEHPPALVLRRTPLREAAGREARAADSVQTPRAAHRGALRTPDIAAARHVARQSAAETESRWTAAPAAVNLDQITENVLRQIDRRVNAWRERTGRV